MKPRAFDTALIYVALCLYLLFHAHAPGWAIALCVVGGCIMLAATIKNTGG